MSETVLPHIIATFDSMGTVENNNFTIYTSVDFDNRSTSTQINSSWITTIPGVTPLYLFDETIYDIGFVMPLELGGASTPSFTSFQEGASDSSVEVYAGLFCSYSTRMEVDQVEGELSILREQYQKYGTDRGFEYNSFTQAYSGITTAINNQVNNVLNSQNLPVIVFKKTTQKPVDLNSLTTLTSSVAPTTTPTTTYTTATAMTTTATTTSTGTGGGY